MIPHPYAAFALVSRLFVPMPTLAAPRIGYSFLSKFRKEMIWQRNKKAN